MSKFVSQVNVIVLIGFSFLLISCSPPAYNVRSHPASPQLPSVTLYFYPTKGQTKEQQERDRYDCYQWAKKQTGYDPG